MFSRLTFLLSLLKALSASTNSRHSLLSSLKLFLAACIAASVPDSSPAHVCSVSTACMMSSFSSSVIVLLMIRCKHSPTPTGLMLLSFFFSGTSLHARRVDMQSCGMVSGARRLARVAISSASIFEWVPYDFEQIISLQVSMSICVGLPDPVEFLVLDVISSWVMFSKMTLSVLVSGLSIMAECFSSATFGCVSLSFFLMSVVMSCFPSISLAWSTILKAFLTCLCNINLQKAFWSDCFLVLTDLLSLFWMALHSEISSSLFPPLHSFVQVFYMFSVFWFERWLLE